MRVLITGGAGFIGSHIAEEILKTKKDCKVVVYDNLTVGKMKNIPEGCVFIKGDVRDKNSLIEAMENVDVVFHNAAFVSIRGSFERLRETLESNFMGTLNVLEACVEANVKKIVFASSMDVYGEPQYVPVDEKHPLNTKSPYGLSKVTGELLCKVFKETYGLDYVILRYFNTYGTRQTLSSYVGVTTIFINKALNKDILTVFGNGNQTRDYVWVNDVARANVLAGFSNVVGIFNVGSGQEVSVNQIADMIIKNLGGEKKYLDAPPGEIQRISADMKKAKEVLGFQPQGKLEEKMPELIEWWKQQK
jgi:UDP-glucose 4-epimerase